MSDRPARFGAAMTGHHVVIPYPCSNSSVRVRALHWIDRLVESGQVDAGSVAVHGPDQPRSPLPPGEHVLLLRNVRRMTRGRLESRILCAADLGVYDIDDGLPWDDGNLADLGHWTKRVFPRSTVARRAARSADRIIAGNEVLADWGATWCDDVRLIPTCVEPSDYVRKSSWDLHDPPIIAWIGSPATEIYLCDIAPALEEVHRRTGARLRMISGPGPVPAALASFTDKSVWTPGPTGALADADIGVMPLRDGVYERAKCGYKLLQYAATGLPIIASPVGVNRALIGRADGVCAEHTRDWTDALMTVVTESSARRAERAARGWVVATEYSYDAWESDWTKAVDW